MSYYKIKNWELYQHYKHRSPKWIKLYSDFISSDTWVLGNDASRALAIGCMLLASRLQNNIPADPEYIRKVLCMNRDPDFTHLLNTGFVEKTDDASNVLAECTQDASKMLAQSRVEKSRVEKSRVEQKLPCAKSSHDARFEEFWIAYPRKMGKGAALRSWKRIHPDEELSSKILDAIAKQKTSDQWNRDGGKYIPLPTTWLNQERWHDEILPAQQFDGLNDRTRHNIAVVQQLIEERRNQR